MKSNDLEEKYTAALAYYKKKDYYKAGQLFDELLIAFKADARFQEIYFYYAYSKYGNGETLLASYHFKNYYESFPTSEKAEEALYMHVYCDYLEAYPYFLDPTGTKMAMDNIQLFINIFPTSQYIPECNKYIDDLRGRLRKKSLESAKLYLKMMDYQGAMMAYNNTIKDYPELENKDQIEATLIRCQYLLATNSVDSKKEERLKQIPGMVRNFEKRYGRNNKYYPEVKTYLDKTSRVLSQLTLTEGISYFEQGEFVLAAKSFQEEKNKPGQENKDQLYYWTIRSLLKAGKELDDNTLLEQALNEANAFLNEFGEKNTYTKKVKRLKSQAEKAIKR